MTDAMKVKEALLPCPFCGGVAQRFDDHDTGSINEGMSCIECTRCHACSAMHGDRKENLVDSWNTRAPSPAVLEPEHCTDCGQELPIRYPCHEQGCTIKCRF